MTTSKPGSVNSPDYERGLEFGRAHAHQFPNDVPSELETTKEWLDRCEAGTAGFPREWHEGYHAGLIAALQRNGGAA